jgi:hypothetical protein
LSFSQEEDLGVPAGTARGEKYPGSGDEWWNGWNFGLTYNDAEYTYAHTPQMHSDYGLNSTWIWCGD